jgi:hypothetical protein
MAFGPFKTRPWSTSAVSPDPWEAIQQGYRGQSAQVLGLTSKRPSCGPQGVNMDGGMEPSTHEKNPDFESMVLQTSKRGGAISTVWSL